MINAFDRSALRFENAAAFNVQKHRVEGCGPIQEMAAAGRMLFHGIKSLEDPSLATALGVSAWQLQVTVICALQPFSHPDLALRKKADKLTREAAYYPTLQPIAEAMANVAQYLIEHSDNPKREMFLSLLQNARQIRSNSKDVGLVTKLFRGSVHEYPESLFKEIHQIAPGISYIAARNDLGTRMFDRIIMPAGGKHCPFQIELWLGYRSRQLDILYYPCEAPHCPTKPTLPPSTYERTGTAPASDDSEVSLGSPAVEEEHRFEHLYWDYVRDSVRRECGSFEVITQSELSVKARLIILADDSAVWLAEEKRILSGTTASTTEEDCFSYRRLSALREGDFVVLRTSGSRVIVREVADAALIKDGKPSLRSQALDWKVELEQTLRKWGTDRIARALAQRSVRLPNPEYLKLWSSDIVMRPSTVERFRVLVRIMKEHGAMLLGEDEEAYVALRWSMMNEVEHYHREAGDTIRNSLLEALRERFREGNIEDHLRLKVPNLGDAEMSLFKVLGVDSETTAVPYRQIETIVRMS